MCWNLSMIVYINGLKSLFSKGGETESDSSSCFCVKSLLPLLATSQFFYLSSATEYLSSQQTASVGCPARTKPEPFALCISVWYHQWQPESVANLQCSSCIHTVFTTVAGRRCLGPHLELALLHPPHNHRLLLCFKPGAGSPLRVGSHKAMLMYL